MLKRLSHLILATCAIATSAAAKNLVPEKPGTAPNYWCTWAAQNYLFGQGAASLDITELEGYTGSLHAQNLMHEKRILGDRGWINFYPKIRGDLFMLLDNGYQVGPATSIEPDPAKFPSFTGTPPERLKQLNDRIKAGGWRGLGLWLGPSNEEAYSRERLQWSRYAGVGYWKVDGSGNEIMLNRLGHEVYPELILEHAVGIGPFNEGPNGRALADYGTGYRLTILQHSDVMRVYDADHPLRFSTTLDRVASALKAASATTDAKGIVNCEDEVYLGAVLGCAVGVFRFPQVGLRPNGDPDVFMAGPRRFKQRIDEVTRAVRWHRIAPPFAASAAASLVDDAVLSDSWAFRPGDTFDASKLRKTIIQSAPARVARGVPLPEVKCEGEPPYVIAARHPNGAVSVGAQGRTRPDNAWFIPPADVTLKLGEVPPAIGVFGRFRSLTFTFNKPLSAAVQIWAQDLAGDEATEITGRVKIDGQNLVLPGHLIDEVGLSAATPGDVSDPGCVINIIDSLAIAAAPNADTCLLFATFRGNGEDGLHLRWSREGVDWKVIQDDKSFLQPAVGARIMRDPSLILGPDGLFHMVWTSGWWENCIGYARSKDLVHWSEQVAIPVMAHEPRAEMCWAPEIRWDEQAKEYLIYWSSSLNGETATPRASFGPRYWRTYATTTTDFKTFTPTRMFFDAQTSKGESGEGGQIDASTVKIGDKYYLFYKQHYNPGGIRYAVAEQLQGPYKDVSPMFAQDNDKVIWEGPSAIQIGDYCVVYTDRGMSPDRADRMGSWRSKDMVHWEDISLKMPFPPRTLHGSVLRVPRSVVEQLVGSHALKAAQEKSVSSGGGAPVPWQTTNYASFAEMHLGLFATYMWMGNMGKPWAYGQTEWADGTAVKSLDELADNLDVEDFAATAAAMRAQYVIFTTAHANMNVLFPSKAVKRHFPGHCSRRDAVGDLIRALSARNIRTILYFHASVAGPDFTRQDQDLVGWNDGPPYRRWNDFINEHVAEMVERYGKNVSGYYIDGSLPEQVDAPRLRKTILDRQHGAWLIQNSGLNRACVDYGARERMDPPYPSTTWLRCQTITDEWWARRASLSWCPELAYRYTILQAAVAGRMGGGVTWSFGPHPGGRWELGVRSFCERLGVLVDRAGASLFGTRPSKAYVTKAAQDWPAEGQPLNGLPFVATESPDGKKTYLHLFLPPKDRDFQLPLPADGRRFSSARLLDKGREVSLLQTGTGVRLTLDPADHWDDVDTIIVLE